MTKLVNNIKRGPLANVIALHDFSPNQPQGNVQKWFTYVVEWFRGHGLEPTRIGLTGETYKGNKTITFRNGLKRLETNEYKDVQGLSLYATPPNHGTDMFDGIFILEYSASNKGDLILCWDNQIAPFDEVYCKQLLLAICPLIQPRYGYAYQRLFKYGPSFYPMGIIGDQALSDEEEDKIAQWGNEYALSNGCYKTGDLRDIYPLNILSRMHLDRVVNGCRFEDWIHAAPQRGSLEQITDSLWTWWVEADNIAAIRTALAPSGMILCV
ncbi:hypothetical protein [Candidatus Odyssella thessalonicensis]|uniref:hypothetical protein n=1 Tax=Candidatus Odyssella thessalonicensis TaxID=84647 RepID=UPI000225A94F|nr:hypothetical protein [Candidatus Odyssella thessalonicensis]